MMLQRSIYRAIGAGLLFLTSGLAALAEERAVFTNSIAPLPPEVSATMAPLTDEDLDQPVDFEIALRVRDYAKLAARVGRREILATEEIRRRYLPAAEDYDQVMKWLAQEGFAITRADPNRVAIFARGTVRQVQQSLQTEMARATVRGVRCRFARTHPSLPKRLAGAVLGINGLQPYLEMRPVQVTNPAIVDLTPYMVGDILGAYDAADVGFTGAGQKIGILIDTAPSLSDVSAFWMNNDIHQTLSNIETVNVSGAALPAPSGEETIDVEWCSGLAPGAKVRVYAAGSLKFPALDACLQQFLSDLPSEPEMHELSISLGLGETFLLPGSQMQTDAQYFALIASHGVTVFAATGDGGSNPAANGGGNGPLQVEYFASDPNVTAVGGTSLLVDSITGAIKSESAWTLGGGGTSIYFSRPGWQTGAGVPAGAMRLVPDVSLSADPTLGAYAVFQGGEFTVGGTSWSAPCWAGFCALINEARSKVGRGPLGLLNPTLYPLLGTNNFHDITTGNNGQYSAGPGFDQATGLGSPDLGVLLQTLTAAGPALNRFSPNAGPVGTAVTLTGSGLAATASVQFGGVNANFEILSDTQVIAVVPAGAVTAPVTVATAGGSGLSQLSFTVTAASAPNDDFANAQAIAGASGSVTGSNAGATREAGEPYHAGNAGGASVWYTWMAPGDGVYTFDTYGSNFDTVLAIYTGGSVEGLASVVANDDAGAGETSAVSFAAAAGVVYHIAVDGHDGEVGRITLEWAQNTVAPAVASYVPNGGNVGEMVVVNGANFTGATAVTFNGVSASFTVISPTQLTALVPAGASTGLIGVVTAAGAASSATRFVVGSAPANDALSQAFGLPGNFGTVAGTNAGATKEPGEPNHAGNPGGASVWWSWTAPCTGQYLVSTAGSSFNTLLAIYTGNSIPGLSPVAASNNAPGAGSTSAVTLNATSGVTYKIAVDGANGAMGNIVLTINPISVTSSLYATKFEPSEGYDVTRPLAAQRGWVSAGSAGNGFLYGVFPAQGEQAYVGSSPPTDGGRSFSLWPELGFTPAPGDLVTFSVLTDIVDSTNDLYDLFHWEAHNIGGDRLFSFEFNNQSNAISYLLDNGASAHPTSRRVVNGHIYNLQITMDFSNNQWSVNLDGTTIVTAQPMTTAGRPLTLGNLRANWTLNSAVAGTNYMVFDNYMVTKTSLVAPQFGLQPQSQAVAAGAGITLAAAAFGSPTIGYQWSKDGRPIPGATAATYAISQVAAADVGSYTVTATNAAGANCSAAALVAIATPAVITAAALPSGTGSVAGAGAYTTGKMAVVTATPAAGYLFANWTDHGAIVSTAASYQFSVVGDRQLAANFQPCGYASWSAARVAQPAACGPLDNPAKDGVVNLLKYGLSLDPNAAAGQGLPVASLQNGFLTLTFRRNKAASDLLYTVQVSSDLVNWRSGAGVTSAPAALSDDGATQVVRVQDLTPAGSAGRRYIRLAITQLP